MFVTLAKLSLEVAFAHAGWVISGPPAKATERASALWAERVYARPHDGRGRAD